MSSWLAVLKIQLRPHLEGKGGLAVSPEAEVLMPAFHGWGEAPPSWPHGRGEGRTPQSVLLAGPPGGSLGQS